MNSITNQYSFITVAFGIYSGGGFHPADKQTEME